MRRRNPTGSRAKFDPGDEPWRCCAESKQAPGERCKNKAQPGRRTCHMHGGTAKGRRPITGRHSAVMGRLQAVYERSLEDPTLFDPREPLAMMAAVVHRCAELCEQRDTPDFRQRAVKTFRAMRKAMARGEKEEVGELLSDLGGLLERGASESSSMTALMRGIEKQGKLINDAWDKLLRREQAITRGDLILLLQTVLNVTHSSIMQLGDGEKISSEKLRRLAALVTETIEMRVLIPAGMSRGATGEGFLIGQQFGEAEDIEHEEITDEPTRHTEGTAGDTDDPVGQRQSEP